MRATVTIVTPPVLVHQDFALAGFPIVVFNFYINIADNSIENSGVKNRSLTCCSC